MPQVPDAKFVTQILDTNSKKEKRERINSQIVSVKLNPKDVFAKRMLKVLANELRDSFLVQNVIKIREENSSQLEFKLKVLAKLGDVQYWKIINFIMVIGKDTGLSLVYEYVENRQTNDLAKLNSRKI